MARTSDCGIPGPEQPDPGLAEDVVPGEHLIGSLTRDDHLEPRLPHESRQLEQRSGRGAKDRCLRVPDDLREDRSRCPGDATSMLSCSVPRRSATSDWNGPSSNSRSAKRSENVRSGAPVKCLIADAVTAESIPPER